MTLIILSQSYKIELDRVENVENYCFVSVVKDVANKSQSPANALQWTNQNVTIVQRVSDFLQLFANPSHVYAIVVSISITALYCIHLQSHTHSS